MYLYAAEISELCLKFYARLALLSRKLNGNVYLHRVHISLFPLCILHPAHYTEADISYLIETLLQTKVWVNDMCILCQMKVSCTVNCSLCLSFV